MEHSFDIEIAKEYGVNCAILLKNIYFWGKKSEANGKHFHDGLYWSYNSIEALAKLFPYLSTNKIRTALSKLEDKGLIKVGNYNKSAYDRTNWYAVTKKGESILQKSQMENDKKENGNIKKDEPIPDVKTDIETDIENKVEQSSTPAPSQDTLKQVKNVIDYLNEKAGTHFKADTKKTIKLISERLKEGFLIEEFYLVIDCKITEWGNDAKMCQYIRPQTLFGEKFEGYVQHEKLVIKGKHQHEHIPVIRSIPFDPDNSARDDNGNPVVF